MIKTFFLLLTILFTPLVFAESGWIKDQATNCVFFNPNPQPDETIKFEGQCNKVSAKGKLSWYLNGELNEVAEGQWTNGKQTGRGTFRFIKAGNSYEGSFLDGKRNGKGIFRWASGTVYEGDFLDGKRTGKGTIKLSSGASYAGDFLDGKMTGRGTIKHSNGTTYTGEVLNGKPYGKGVETYADGGKYVGEFVDGKYHGKGIFDFSVAGAGSFSGEFISGEKSGRGIYALPNGVKLEVNYVNNNASEFVVVTFPGGQPINGRFIGEKFVPDLEDQDHLTCKKFGFASNSADYEACRRQIDRAKQRAFEEEQAYRLKILEAQQRIEQERKETALIQGLSALAGVPSTTYSPLTAPMPMHVYTLPGRKSMTCTTFGAFTNCY
jgi:hypothetical protein